MRRACLAFISALCLMIFMFAGVAGPGLAQDAEIAPDYVEWRSVSERSERLIERGRASKGVLERRRQTLAEWRTQFSSAREENKIRISTLRSQLATLGPVAEDGSDPIEITRRRAELNMKISVLVVPGLTAQEAYNHADGLIQEIDAMIRTQQTERLFSLGPSPLSPAMWQPTLIGILQSFSQWKLEISRAVSADITPIERLETFLFTGFYLLIGLVMLVRGGHWVEAAGQALSRRGREQTEVWRFLISIGRLVLPVAALFALSVGLSEPGLLGRRSALILESLPLWAIGFVSLRWVSGQLLIADEGRAFLQFADPIRVRLHHYALLITLVMLGHNAVFAVLFSDMAFDGLSAVLSLPFIVVLGILLFRVGYFFKSAPVSDNQFRSAGSVRERVIRFVGRGIVFVAFAAPILAAIGYQHAADFVLFNTIETLVLLAVLLVFLKFLTALYGLVMRGAVSVEDSLVPVLLALALCALAVPVLALIWGARVAELTEIWAQFNAGIMLGDARLSPIDFLAFALIFMAGYMITRLMQGALRNSVLPKTKIEIGAQNAITAGVGYVGIFLAALIAISSAGLNLSSLAIVAGALSVGIGFGLQNIVSNFVSGIILLIERPITEGDWIEVAGYMGYVRDISVRSTRIETFDRTDVIVPNADLVSGVVTNWTRGNTVGRVIVSVGVAYGTDTRRVEAVLREIAEAHPLVMTEPAPSVVFQGFGANSMDFEVRAILRDVNWSLSAKSDINHEIAKRFAEEGIEIPFPQRDVWLRNPQSIKENPAS